MRKIGILIYARNSSKRLPRKVTKIIFQNKSLLEIIHSRLKKKSKNVPIIVNTSSNKSDDKIVKICKKKKIKYFRGSLKNLIKRTLECCKKYRINSFVRVNADRPFFDVNLMNRMLNIYSRGQYDIVTNQFPRVCPKGLACEISNVEIFKKILKLKLIKSEKEHFFNYFYKNSNKYKIKNIYDKFYNKKKKLDLSVDTKKQFLKVKKIYNQFDTQKYIDTKNVIKKYERLFK